jgi:two-component system, NtrC family, sensor kinase
MPSGQIDLQMRVQQLEKENRILQKKLERSDATCIQLEENAQKKESLLRQVIHELEESQTRLEEQSLKLNQAFTDLKRTQTQLVQAEKMSSLGQLVAGIAHEINNPVNFIHGNLSHVQDYAQNLLGLIQLYQTQYPNPAPVIQTETEAIDLEFIQTDLPKILDSLKMGTDRIRQIVLSLRNFSRMDEAEFKTVNLHEGIDSTLLILQHRLNARPGAEAIQVIRNYGDLPLIECYPGQLNQAFMNILANAIDALEEVKENPGRITIQTSLVDSEWVKIVISDNGTGMTEPVLRRIFDPFFTTKSVGKGTGMGMSISYQIITEKHEGKLDCFSVPDKGTEFIIQIPVRQEVCDPQ